MNGYLTQQIYATKRKERVAFILGLLSTNNIIAFFRIGSTPIMLIMLFGLFFMVYYSFCNKYLFFSSIKDITLDLKITYCMIFLSGLSVLLFHHQFLYQWFMGVIGVSLYIMIFVLTLMLGRYHIHIIKGIFFGLLLNFVVSLYALFLYQRGIVFSFDSIFPAVSDISIPYIRNSFRAWGFFKEPGHLMRYVAMMALPVWVTISNYSRFKKLIFLLVVLFFVVATRSASVLVFTIGLLLYLIIGARKKRTRVFLLILLIPIVGFSIYVLILSNSDNYIISSFLSGLTDIFDPNSNTIRKAGMRFTVEIIGDYPFLGCGWNTLTQVMIKKGFYSLEGATGSFSEGLSLIAELGVLSLPFFFFLISKTIGFLKQKSSISRAFGCSLFIYFLLFCITDFNLDGGSAVFLGLIVYFYRIEVINIRT